MAKKLTEIEGTGPTYAAKLAEAGVDTVPALAQRNPEHLHKTLTEVAEARKNTVRRAPAASEVAAWVAAAKELPRVITY